MFNQNESMLNVGKNLPTYKVDKEEVLKDGIVGFLGVPTLRHCGSAVYELVDRLYLECVEEGLDAYPRETFGGRYTALVWTLYYLQGDNTASLKRSLEAERALLCFCEKTAQECLSAIPKKFKAMVLEFLKIDGDEMTWAMSTIIAFIALRAWEKQFDSINDSSLFMFTDGYTQSLEKYATRAEQKALIRPRLSSYPPEELKRALDNSYSGARKENPVHFEVVEEIVKEAKYRGHVDKMTRPKLVELIREKGDYLEKKNPTLLRLAMEKLEVA